jgi:hypothetical protein
MRDRYCLGRLENDELLAALSGLVRRGNELTADLLAHLAETYERRLHLALGFPSLFAYCTESLGLSESAAGRRIAAAKVCRRFPEAFARVATGELHLSALCSLAPHLIPQNAAELFEVCRHRSARQVEELLAARFPKPDVRDAIRIDPLSADRFGVHFTADAEFLELLEQVRALASHRQPNGDLLTTMKHGLKAYRAQLEKTRFAVGRKPQRALRALPTVGSPAEARLSEGSGDGERTRHIPAAVAREVYVRDERQCTFVSEDGRRCTARHFIELDHVRPWAYGGESSVGNLRLRCRAHNQEWARSQFGAGHMNAAVTRSRQRRGAIQS